MAPKHLKVRATLHPDMKRVTIKILEQSHFLKDFGLTNNGYMFGDSSHQLYSALEGVEDSSLPYRFYVAGCPADLKKVAIISLEKWKWVRIQLQKYNEWGATQ